MVTVPGATPVTNPLLSIVATPAKLLDQEIATPATGFPAESKAVAVNCDVPFTRIDGGDSGVSFTLATLVATVIVAVLLVTPCADAVICDVPAATPVTTPFASTVATLVALLAHANVPDKTLLFTSTAAAKKVCDCPTDTVPLAGVTVIFVIAVVPVEDEPPPQLPRTMLKRITAAQNSTFAQRGPSLSMIPLPRYKVSRSYLNPAPQAKLLPESILFLYFTEHFQGSRV